MKKKELGKIDTMKAKELLQILQEQKVRIPLVIKYIEKTKRV